MQLERLRDELAALAGLGAIETRLAAADATVEVTDVVHDSRDVAPGVVFCAVPGRTVDGHSFVLPALASGAAAVVAERWFETERPQFKVESVREVMPFVAAAVHGNPSRDLSIFGITGTNGKTTTTQLFAAIMHAAGRDCTVIGTLGGVHTTPESTDLQRRLRIAVDAGVEVAAVEVSSHALDQRRVDATRFAVAAFSNLTPDHLDYHGDMESYFAAKRRLFDGRAEVELINVDDPWGARLAAERPSAHAVTSRDVEVVGESIAGTDIVWRGVALHVPLPGAMNVANALMAAEAARALGINHEVIVAGLCDATAVPGRMERVTSSRADAPTVIVDYSHAPDSIDRALETIRRVEPHAQVSIVFGCGGDRDRTKRPMMGRAAEAGADRVYLTSDNPRSENPLLIIADALAGVREPDAIVVEPDRRRAIELAIADAKIGDVVLIAGKGHEKTQTVGSEVLPFDDVQVARRVLEGKSR